jgi:hypothetical protein
MNDALNWDLQVGSIWISYAVVVAVLFLFAIGFVKLYQHRMERDAFVTTVAVLAITTVHISPLGLHGWGLMIGVGDDMFVSGGYCACVDDGGSESWITETMGVA